MDPDKLQAGLTLLLVLSAAPCAGQPLARADRPDVRVGDTWVYRESDARTGEKREISFRVTLVDTDRIVAETGISTSGAWTFTRDWNVVERKRGDAVFDSLKPHMPHFRFPLEVGGGWEAAFEREIEGKRGTRHARWQWKGQVVAAEVVTVPAGMFQTLKIVSEGTFASREGGRSWTGTHRDTKWYAPEVKRSVKHVYVQSVPATGYLEHREFELLSFRLAR
jgi:hypothetical protein